MYFYRAVSIPESIARDTAVDFRATLRVSAY